MVLFAKATILLNELVLILCFVYLCKWKMKDGKYRNKKTVWDKNHESIKRNVKFSQSMYPTQSFSTSAAGWPLKILLKDPLRCQTCGVPWQRTDPCSPSVRFGVSWGMSFTGCSVAKVLCQDGQGGQGLASAIQSSVRPAQGASGTCAPVSVPAQDTEVAECAPEGLVANSHFIASVRFWELHKTGPLQPGPHPSACC